MDEYIKRTGEVAMKQAKKNNTYIVYEKGGKLVKEYPSGKIVLLKRGRIKPIALFRRTILVT
ncbi:hypothetical protein AB1K91_15030 [Terribacillus sp. 179-K 1B1 HS]|uniref:hypothetical protein n=1 Tax=Terribacillus sp. 179-K 1B1 HS TaxID=3142388 RepID=UPI0039A2CF54